MQNIFDNIIEKKEIFKTSFENFKQHTFFTKQDEEIYCKTENFNKKKQLLIYDNSGENEYLLSQITFFIDLPNSENWVDDVEFALIKKIDLLIGGSIMHTLTNDQIYMYSKINKISGKNKNSFYITIPFFFNNKNNGNFIGLSLPVLSLQHHDIKINFEYENLENLVKYGVIINKNINFNCKIIVDKIYLSEEEKKKFIQTYYKYLISQNQNIYKQINCDNYNLDLSEIYFCVRNFKFAFRDKVTNVYFNYLPICKNAKFYVNGILTFDKLGETLIDENNIYTYSFELCENEFEPSGSLNFSMTNNNLELDLKNTELTLVFSAENFNALHIINGMAGLKFIK